MFGGVKCFSGDHFELSEVLFEYCVCSLLKIQLTGAVSVPCQINQVVKLTPLWQQARVY